MNLLRVPLELLPETMVVDSFGAIGVRAESDCASIERQKLRNRSMVEWHSPYGRHELAVRTAGHWLGRVGGVYGGDAIARRRRGDHVR